MKHLHHISQTPLPFCAQDQRVSNDQLLALIAIVLAPLALIYRFTTQFKLF